MDNAELDALVARLTGYEWNGLIVAARDAIATLKQERDLANDGWHMANGTAELAMKHRDLAEQERDTWQALAAAADADMRKAQSETDALRHDIECHVAITSEQAEEIERLRALLHEAYNAMREPTGEWHDVKCNTVLPKIRAALAKCDPTQTVCPRCNNDIHKCDGAFSIAAPEPTQEQRNLTPEEGAMLHKALLRGTKRIDAPPQTPMTEVERNAARYEWLRDESAGHPFWQLFDAGCTGAEMDAAIDAALRREGE